MNLTENEVLLASVLARGYRPQEFLADADISCKVALHLSKLPKVELLIGELGICSYTL
jgi:hypothetical protein